MPVTKPKLDLLFPSTHNLYTIGVIDVSEYPLNYNINYPSIEITVPGRNREVLQISPKNLTIYNSAMLKITCDDEDLTVLPDGIWEFKYSFAPVYENFVEKKFLKVDLLRQRLENAFLRMDMNCDIKQKDMDRIQEIGFFIEGAIASANQCDLIDAMKKYKLADKLLKNFING